jgi:hypothetical protein
MVIASTSSVACAVDVNVRRFAAFAKYWLNPVALAQNMGFAARHLAEIEAKVTEQQARF